MSQVLVIAGLYNLIWGGWVILFPEQQFKLFDMPLPNYLEFWQCIGMIVGVYGIGYLLAAQDPRRHYPIILVGLLGKVLGPIGFMQALMFNKLPLAFGLNIIFNDLIWWFPFFIILRDGWHHAIKSEHHLVVIMDGECQLCRKFCLMVKKLDWLRLVTFISLHDNTTYQTYPQLSQTECLQEIKSINAKGEIFGGAQAMLFIAFRLPLLSIPACFLSLPLFLPVLQKLYRKISSNRHCINKICQ